MLSSILGYHDISQLWKDELEIADVEKLVNELYEEIKPLYIQVSFLCLKDLFTDIRNIIM